MIDETSSLEDVCFFVAEALEKTSIEAVLTGGSAATMYAPHVYTSFDADFVLKRSVILSDLTKALEPLGYRPAATRGMFEHSRSRFTIDFPRGPLAVGGDYVQRTATLKRNGIELRILTPTDCVKDRLAHFYFWDDRTALNAAVGVATSKHGQDVDFEELQKWTEKESSSGTDYRPKLAIFLEHAGLTTTESRNPDGAPAQVITYNIADMHPMLSSDRFGPANFVYVRMTPDVPGSLTIITKSLQDSIVDAVLYALGAQLLPVTKADGILFTSKIAPPSDVVEPQAQWASRCYVRRDGDIEIRNPEMSQPSLIELLVGALAASFVIAAQVFKVVGAGPSAHGSLTYKVSADSEFRLATDTTQPFAVDFSSARFADMARPLLLYLQRQGGYPGELSDFDGIIDTMWNRRATIFEECDSRKQWR